MCLKRYSPGLMKAAAEITGSSFGYILKADTIVSAFRQSLPECAKRHWHSEV